MAGDRPQGSAFPQGLDERHVDVARGWRGHASPLSLIVLAALLGTALTGVLGGKPSPVAVASTSAATLSVKTPDTLRNGVFFETEIGATPRAAAKDLTIAVDRTLWRDLTVNTMIPAPAEETFEDGRFRFSYGPVEAGRTLTVKIDSQVNPALVGRTGGKVGVYDGDRLLAEVELTMQVRP